MQHQIQQIQHLLIKLHNKILQILILVLLRTRPALQQQQIAVLLTQQ